MMPEKAAFLTFLFAAFMLNIAPGPDMLYVIGRSVGQGRKAGIVSALGIFVGCWAHILAAAFGIAALLRSSPIAFNIVRYAGAAYLVYLGIKMLVQHSSLAQQQLKPDSLSAIFRQGAITNVLNPKVALFFLAFLPQFVDARRGSIVWQILLLGLIFNVGGTLVNLGVAYAGGTLGELLRRNARFARLQQWFTGLVFIGLGARLAWQRR
ncbi:MAG TPA: LysE family translocator [Candidatus Angelobacter sp.]|jgi:threonine/homoserine/homoserine lactone efflux protein